MDLNHANMMHVCTACGPGPMSTNIAATLSKVYSAEEVAKGGASVDFHAETFGM